MSDIKVGQVATLKTSDEPVFVLDIEECEATTNPKLSGVEVKVRRPVGGQDGVRHVVETFHLEELESLDAKHTRQIAEMEEVRARLSPNGQAPASPSDLFSRN
jgi:hypothetical protein